MSIVIFVVILAVLILVHEFGHFLAAKLFGIRVDEFGIGYPPRAATLFKFRGTEFTLNWIPFGGFVKILGENGEATDVDGKPLPEVEAAKSFTRKPRYAQALVLVAGVGFNLIFAWLLISLGFMIGLPTSTSAVPAGQEISNPQLVISLVSPESPAEKSGLKSGDVITAVAGFSGELTPDSVSNYIGSHGEDTIAISYKRGDETGVASAEPVEGIIQGRKAIGISMDTIGTLTLSFFPALWEGARTTVSLVYATAVGLGSFIVNIFTGDADFSQVTGPVGIVGLVGDASRLGIIYLLSFTAFISINLAVINVIPFPALDGGRLLFVIIEAIKRSPMSPKVTGVVNFVGFALLILLMVFVTVHDVVRLF